MKKEQKFIKEEESASQPDFIRDSDEDIEGVDISEVPSEGKEIPEVPEEPARRIELSEIPRQSRSSFAVRQDAVAQ